MQIGEEGTENLLIHLVLEFFLKKILNKKIS
jgi:hypothetical protein